MPGPRRYDDPCGVARALDVVGERWALLVVRELLFGPKRFADLRAGLPRLSQNVLSTRLDELEGQGVVRRRRLGPPASTWVYELTERGQELEPVLFHLGRWGSRTRPTSVSELSKDALMLALRTTFDPAAAGDLRATYELRLGEDRFRVDVAEGRIDIARGAPERPDAVIEAGVGTLRRLVFGERQLAGAQSAGTVEVEGDQEAAERLMGLFARPTPAD
jgi:DNA-binding HxlR family transcriptional regulator/putative sterol carrier protein